MKQISLVLSIILTVLGLCGCSKEEMALLGINGGINEVTISLGGDFAGIFSEPLTKGDERNSYYAFEVDSLHIVESHVYLGGDEYTYVDTTYFHYAEGVFDNTGAANLKIRLENGHKYKVKCSIVIDGEESLYVRNDCIQEPFASSLYGMGTKCRITNCFTYGESKTVYTYNTMNVVRVEDGNMGTNKWHAMVDRYYGEVETDGMTAVIIGLQRRNFGLHFNLVPPVRGTLKVFMTYGTPKFEYVLTPGSPGVDEEHIYSLDLVNDFANIYLKIKWTDEGGTEYDLSPANFKAYNKTMTNIGVNINGRITEGGSSDTGIGLEWDNSIMENNDLYIN